MITRLVRRHRGRRHLDRRHQDDGLTAVELVVGAAISSIVLAGVATVMIATADLSRQSLARTDNSRDVRAAAEVISTALRVGARPAGEAAALVMAKPDEIRFYALLNRTGSAATTDVAPTLVRYWWDSSTTCLNQSRVVGAAIASPAPSGPYWTWTAAPDVRCLMRTTTAPTFTYYDTPTIIASGVEVSDLGAPASGLAAGSLPGVRSVQVQLTARDPNRADVPGSAILDRVTLNNA